MNASELAPRFFTPASFAADEPNDEADPGDEKNKVKRKDRPIDNDMPLGPVDIAVRWGYCPSHGGVGIAIR